MLSQINRSSVVLVGGTPARLTPGVPARGIVGTFRVEQVAGALEGFTYTLYDSAAAVDNTGTVNADPTIAVAAQITPVLVAPAGQPRLVGNFPIDGICNLRLPYACATDVNGNSGTVSSSNRGRNLFVRIAPAGSGSKTFVIVLGVMEENL